MITELETYDNIIRHELARRSAMQDMATFFIGQVALHDERIAGLTEERNVLLRSLDNVVLLQSGTEGGAA